MCVTTYIHFIFVTASFCLFSKFRNLWLHGRGRPVYADFLARMSRSDESKRCSVIKRILKTRVLSLLTFENAYKYLVTEFFMQNVKLIMDNREIRYIKIHQVVMTSSLKYVVKSSRQPILVWSLSINYVEPMGRSIGATVENVYCCNNNSTVEVYTAYIALLLWKIFLS